MKLRICTLANYWIQETIPNSNLNLSDRQYYLTKENLLHPEKMGITPVLGLKESFIGRRDFLQNVTEVYNNSKNGIDLLLYPVKAEEVKR